MILLDTPKATSHDLHECIRLQAATSALITRFQTHQCPKLAHLIVQQLRQIVSNPAVAEAAGSRELYLKLLGHWQTVSTALLEQRQQANPAAVYH